MVARRAHIATMYSSNLYAGFTTDASGYTVLEGGSVTVTIRLTIPIDCSYPASSTSAQIAEFEEHHCSVTIRVRTPTYYEDGQLRCTGGGVTDEPVTFKNENCGVVFPFNDWDTPKTLTVFGAADNTINDLGSRSIHIRFRADNGILNPAWGFATKPDIQVIVEDQDIQISGRSCTVRTDPHVYTFDRRYFSFQQSGEYILFKHDTLPIRVHAIFDRCFWGRGTCTCGIAIRNQDAVFIINLCSATVGSPLIIGSSNTNRYVEMRACDDTHMTVESSGSQYSVTLPSGTLITLAIATWSLPFIRMFHLKPSLADWKSSTGLCGFLDGDPTNDFRNRDGTVMGNPTAFGLGWRLNTALDGISLFDISNTLADIPLPPLQYCKCTVNTNNPQAFNSQVLCNITSTITACNRRNSSAGFVQQCDKARQKRETPGYFHRYRRSTEEDIFEIPKFDVVLDAKYENVVENYTWQNGWTEALAEQSCRDMMDNDPMLIKCEEVVPLMNIAVEEGMTDCINDIKISGDTDFMTDTVESLKSSCLVEAKRFENLTTQGSNSNGATFLDDLLELSCPNNCSGNGKCANGICDCHTGFYGAYCALERDAVPEILHRGMTCSIDKKSCNNFVISGNNFLDINLTCHARLLKVYIDRWEFIGVPIVFPARYLNEINCVCIIPDSVRRRRAAASDQVFGQGYLLSISNDGFNFSNETTIIAYDSTCYKCDSTNISCTQLESCASTSTLATTEAALTTASSTGSGTGTTQLSSTITAIGTGTVQPSSTNTVTGTGTVQPSSTHNVTGTGTVQPSSTNTVTGTGTVQPSSTHTVTGTGTVQPSSTNTVTGTGTGTVQPSSTGARSIPLTATEPMQNESSKNEDDLPLGAILGGIAGGIVLILTVTTALVCVKYSKYNRSKIGLSNADMTNCHTSERYTAESEDKNIRPASASGIQFQFGIFPPSISV